MDDNNSLYIDEENIESKKEYSYRYKTIKASDVREMSNGMRNISGTALTDDEIDFIKSEIKRIQADENVFIFNDPDHVNGGTCYNFELDKIFVTKNVLPDDKYASIHPRDTMSVGAVLAHEYYGHRSYRDEYIKDLENGVDYHTTPIWDDECRASLTAAQIAPGLTDIDRRDLVMDAIYRAKEFGQLIEMDDFMKEVVYGYKNNERKLTREYKRPTYISETSKKGIEINRKYIDKMSEMRNIAKNHNDTER